MHQRSADMLVIPNSATQAISAQYTSPLKLFAHMASEVPLVVSNVPSLQSVVGHAEVSFFEADNAVSLAEVISSTFSRYQESLEKASKLAQRAQRHTWTERARLITNFISS
jgi:glycosyltransferase involved in cell wall biosynthesis